MWPISRGFFLVKRASPSSKGPPVSRGPRLLGARPYFPFQVFVLGGEKHGQEHRVPWTIHFGKEEPGPSFCLPLNECGNNQKRARTALLSFLISLGQFQGPLHRPRLGSQGKPNEKGSTSYSRNEELLPKGREREGFVCGPGSMMGVPLHSLTSLKHSTNRVAYVQGRKPSYTAGRWRAWGLEEKIHPRAF